MPASASVSLVIARSEAMKQSRSVLRLARDVAARHPVGALGLGLTFGLGFLAGAGFFA